MGAGDKNPTASEFLAVAASQIGYKEGYDSKGKFWNNDTKFGKWYGLNKQPWCAMFISWCANEVGGLGTIVPKYASTFAGLTWFRKKNQTGNWPPRAGDIFMMREYNPGAWNADAGGYATIHTGIVEKYLGNGRFQTIEGNTNPGGSAQGNGVYRLIRQDSPTGKKFIYARPAWARENVVVPKPQTKPPVAAKTPVKPAPVITPPAKPKPISGAAYNGSRDIRGSLVRPNNRNEAVRRFNGLLWSWLCKNSPNYARQKEAAWMKEAANLYGREGQLATQEAYRVLTNRDPNRFAKVKLPTWPGARLIEAIGGRNVD